MATSNGDLGDRNGSHAKGSGSGHANGAGSRSLPVDWERLARTTAHPLRVSILEILGLDGGRTLSPNDLSQELQIPLSNTNYHVTELAKDGLIELCGQRQVRGATEHFYRLPGTADSPDQRRRAPQSTRRGRHPGRGTASLSSRV